MAKNSVKNEGRLRLSLFAAFLCLWLLAICVRLVWLQIGQYGFLTQKAARQQQRSIEVSPPRGVIYDRKGRELAMSVQVDSVFAVPSGNSRSGNGGEAACAYSQRRPQRDSGQA